MLLNVSLVAAALLFFGTAVAKDIDAETKLRIVRESQQTYRGSCPCPENFDRGGRRCGKRSAYSKPGGASPLCYISDVTPEMLKKYKERDASTH